MGCSEHSSGHAGRGAAPRIDRAAEAVARAQNLIGSRPLEGPARLAWHHEAMHLGDAAAIGALLISRDSRLIAR
jgi:hypothetical protein